MEAERKKGEVKKGKRAMPQGLEIFFQAKKDSANAGSERLLVASAKFLSLVREKNFGQKSGQVGRGRKNRDVGQVPHIVVLDKVRGSSFEFAFFQRKMVKTMFVGVFHLLFKKEKTAAGVVVVLFLLRANLLDNRLLNTGEQQARHIVDHQTGGGNEHQDPKCAK